VSTSNPAIRESKRNRVQNKPNKFNNMSVITFTEESFVVFQQSYESAVKNHQSSFFFDGKEFLTDYAKYVIQYVQLKK
jgi:hypothetical protein